MQFAWSARDAALLKLGSSNAIKCYPVMWLGKKYSSLSQLYILIMLSLRSSLD